MKIQLPRAAADGIRKEFEGKTQTRSEQDAAADKIGKLLDYQKLSSIQDENDEYIYGAPPAPQAQPTPAEPQVPQSPPRSPSLPAAVKKDEDTSTPWFTFEKCGWAVIGIVIAIFVGAVVACLAGTLRRNVRNRNDDERLSNRLPMRHRSRQR